MATVHIPTFAAADAALKARFQTLLASGEARRALIFWDIVPASLPLMTIACLLPPTLQNRRAIQVALYAVICALSLDTYLHVRSDHSAFNYGLGLQPVYVVIWTGVVLFLQDPAGRYERLEYNVGGTQVGEQEKKEKVGRESNGGTSNGHAKESLSKKEAIDRANTPGPTLHWQRYPSTWLHRISWFYDLNLNFRYIGWKEQAPYLGFRAQDIETSVAKAKRASPGDPPVIIVGRSGNRTFFQPGPAIRAKLFTLITSFAILDVGTWLARKDPYFWALDLVSDELRSSSKMPGPDYLPVVLANSPVYLRVYRIAVSSAVIIASLNSLLAIPPICLLLCSYLPAAFDAHTTVTAPWHWPDEFGSMKAIYDYGLAGGWGGFWHQTFRNTFTAPSEMIFERFGIDQKGLAGRLIQALFAFGISGILHGATAHVQITQHNRPFSGPFMFFMLQGVGIFLQVGLGLLSKQLGLYSRFPAALRGWVNIGFVVWWSYLVAPRLADDFALNVWLWQPTPVSFVRLIEGKSFVVPNYMPSLKWVDNGSWWNSGWGI